MLSKMVDGPKNNQAKDIDAQTGMIQMKYLSRLKS
jgi:hypothetical protein